MGTEETRGRAGQRRRAVARSRLLVPAIALALLPAGSAFAHGGEELTGATAWWSWNVTPEISGPLLLVAAVYVAGMRRRANAGVASQVTG